MGRAMVCVVECERGEFNPATHCCGNQTHSHISQDDARIREFAGIVEWIKEPKSSRDKGIVRVLRENYSLRGLSCRVGSTLAEAIKRGEPWALAMRRDISR